MIRFRFAEQKDVDLYFDWANDPVTRVNSYNQAPIDYASHVKWFNEKVQSVENRMYLFLDDNEEPVGQVRIEKDVKSDAQTAIISISIDKLHRGKGYGPQILQMASADFLTSNPNYKIIAYIFVANEASYKSFIKAGFKKVNQCDVKGIESHILEKSVL